MSRGTIHISSTSPFTAPTINPNYLQHPADKFLLAKGLSWLRSVVKEKALQAVIEKELQPGATVKDADLESYLVKGNVDTESRATVKDADIEIYLVKGNVITEFHPIGTSSMLPKSQNGVVSPQLVVYGEFLRAPDFPTIARADSFAALPLAGTKNVRVVDASVIPLHISAHVRAFSSFCSFARLGTDTSVGLSRSP